MSDAAELDQFLYRSNLAVPGDGITWTPLAGGVSSDIWRVDLPLQTICVKRALATLKVAADWQAPIERNNYEWEWFKFTHEHFPGIVPQPLAHNSEMQMLAMEYLEPEEFPVWKGELLDGVADAVFAGKIGTCLGKIHSASAGDDNIRERFANDDFFFALRIEPYLLATAEKHPDIAIPINVIARHTLALKIALVHGDISPKNILKGIRGPIFLDAETAWYGDPAFDLAFCLNHFLLKSVYNSSLAENYLKCFFQMIESYLIEVDWETPDMIEGRTAALLPILLLARIDGKSPIEYLNDDHDRNLIRSVSRKFIAKAPKKLCTIAFELLSRLKKY